MVRHARGQVGIQLPPRRAHTIRLKLSAEERALYGDVSAFVRRCMAGEDGESKLSMAHRFTLQTLQREIGSSPAAARPTLLALADHDALAADRETLLALADRAGQIAAWAKGRALEKLLQAQLAAGSDEKLIIFTHFRVTLDLLADLLRGMNVNFVLYHGGLTQAAKNEAISRFEVEAQALLSTEAAGEGRNLQFCRNMINFDLPWNPMRIEQRVGRIHRVGQTREVNIFNLSAEDTVEDYILNILDSKLNMFELVIGEMDMILGQLEDERDFEDLILDVWLRATTPDEAATRFEELGEALARAKEHYRQTRAYDEALFGEDFAAE
jgi:SNF2 family DNA or RNA helicase